MANYADQGRAEALAALELNDGNVSKTASRRLGHASAAFTSDTYGHLLKRMQRTAPEAMDHLLA